jgi:hypothetical protein
MQRMEKVCIVAEKVYIRGYQTAKKVYFEEFFFYIFEDKVYNIYQKNVKWFT